MGKNNNKKGKREEERRGSKRLLSTEFTIGENFMKITYSLFQRENGDLIIKPVAIAITLLNTFIFSPENTVNSSTPLMRPTINQITQPLIFSL